MPPARRWLRLDADYYNDDRIASVGWDAEHLYLRGLAWAKAKGTDGRISLSVVSRLATGYDGDVPSLVYKLMDAGLWLPWRDGMGYTIANYERWQGTEAEWQSKLAYNRMRQENFRKRKRDDNGDA